MNRYERVKATIEHKQTDKIPTCIHLAEDGCEAHFPKLFERYVTGELLEKYQQGKISYKHAIYYGMGNHVLPVFCPWWDWHDVGQEYKEYDTPDSLPKTVGRGSYDDFIATVKSLKENLDCYVLVLVWESHFEKAYYARGIENFLSDMVADPDYAKNLLDFIINKNIVMLQNIVNIPGIDGILLGSDWGSQKDMLMSPDTWRSLIKPGEIREYELIKKAGLDVWVHSCGNIERILPDIVEMGVDVLNPIQPECMDIYKIKDTYGKNITFWGGISTQDVLPYGTVEEVKQETKKVTKYMSQEGGFIIAPSQEIQADVSFENLCALIDQANAL
jgi:uroporphyrinogen decarboxylase